MNLQPSKLSMAVRRVSACMWVPGLVLASTIANADCSVAPATAAQLDWVPLADLTAEQLQTVPVACCGAYIAPVRTDDEADMEPEQANLFGSADSSESDLTSSMILRDNVVLRQGSRSLATDLFKLNQETSDAELIGNIQMREPGMLARADYASINIQDGAGKLEKAEFVMYETRVRGRAEKLEKFKDNVMVLTGGMVTSCEPGDNTWAIHGQSITVNNDERYGVAKHMRLNIKDVPVFYFPYVRFPVGPDRLTGFLFPSLSINSNGIDDLRVPFYWNIAPNMDAIIEPRYMEERGYLMYTEVRHLSRYFLTEFDGSYLSDDTSGLAKRLRADYEQGAVDYATAHPYEGQARWQYQLLQKGGMGERWKTEIDYTDVSDTDYIRDIDRGAVDLNRSPYIRQRVQGSYMGDNWLFSAYAQEMRLLTDVPVPYSEMPRVNLNGMYRFDDWVLELRNEYARFDLTDDYDQYAKRIAIETGVSPADDMVVGERLRTDYNIGWDREFAAGFFRPRVGVKTLTFSLGSPNLQPEFSDNTTFVTPQASLDTGLAFERDFKQRDNNFTQTLEPRVFYLWRDYDEQTSLNQAVPGNGIVNFDSSQLSLTYQQLFRDSRFSGGDRLDDTNQVTLGLTSRFIDNDSGIERLRLGVGQIFYFEDRQVELGNVLDEPERNKETTSKMAGYIGGQIGDHFTFVNDLTYDPYHNKISTVSSTLRYMDDNYRIFNLGYRYSNERQALSPIMPDILQRETLNQIDASAIWPINGQWSGIARINYDFDYHADIDTVLGLEYNDCCYRVRLMARQWLDYDLTANFLDHIDSDDYDRGVFVEVQLKGIGTISRKIGRLLDKAIYGYSEREAAQN